MKINVLIQTSKLATYYTAAIKEYTKRLSKYCKVNLELYKSFNELKNKIPSGTYKIRISPTGDILSSEELSSKLNQLAVTGKSTITIIICEDDVLCNELISISPMDMNSGLLTTVLFEQIYRAFRIMHNHAYHK